MELAMRPAVLLPDEAACLQAYPSEAAQQLKVHMRIAARRACSLMRGVAGSLTSTISTDFYDALKGKNTDVWGDFRDLGYKAVADVAAKMLETKFIIPTVTDIVGTVSGSAVSVPNSSVDSDVGIMGSMFGSAGTFGSSSELAGFLGVSSSSGGIMDALFGTAATPALAPGAAVGDVVAGETLTAADVSGTAATDGLISSGGFSSLGVGSLGSLAGGIGGGFLSGSLLNSVAGGNSTNGEIGSAVGSVAGAVIGSVVPVIGTFLGGLAGGALGKLKSNLFGEKR